MSLHYWLGWLAFCLAWLWLGQTLQRPLPEAVAIAAFNDGYLISREFRLGRRSSVPAGLLSALPIRFGRASIRVTDRS
jgi:hypothetical protein